MSSRLRWEQDVAASVAYRPHLLPIFGDVLGVVDAVREYNPDLFIVLNTIREQQRASGLHYKQWHPIPPGVIPIWGAWYEVHNLRQGRGTLVMSVPYGALDKRVVHDLWKTDVRVHGDALLRRLDEENEALERRQARETANRFHDMALDMAPVAARAAWGPSVFGPGGPPRTDLFQSSGR